MLVTPLELPDFFSRPGGQGYSASLKDSASNIALKGLRIASFDRRCILSSGFIRKSGTFASRRTIDTSEAASSWSYSIFGRSPQTA